MTNIKLRCVSQNAPNEVVEVIEKKVAGLLATGMYELADKPKENKFNKPVKSLKVEKHEEDLNVKNI